MAARGADKDTIATAYQWGSLAGGLAGDFTGGALTAGRFLSARALRAGLTHVGPDLLGAGVGAIIGYGLDHSSTGALHGANVGMMAGGIAGGVLRGRWAVQRAKSLRSTVNVLEGRTAGSRFEGELAEVFEDFRQIVPGVRYEFIDFEHPELLGHFDEINNLVQFSKGRRLGVVTLADEMQHALDYKQFRLTRLQIFEKLKELGIGPRRQYGWYHQRLFIRAVQNIERDVPGFRRLKPYIGEVLDAYLSHGGELTKVEDIMKIKITSPFD